ARGGGGQALQRVGHAVEQREQVGTRLGQVQRLPQLARDATTAADDRRPRLALALQPRVVQQSAGRPTATDEVPAELPADGRSPRGGQAKDGNADKSGHQGVMGLRCTKPLAGGSLVSTREK